MITARTLRLTGGTNQTITGSFDVHGSFGAKMSLVSSDATPVTITANIGTINARYVILNGIAAAGTSIWNAINCVDNGNNSGWIFSVEAIVQAFVVDAWKVVTGMQIRVGGAWKQITAAKIKISGVWKTIF